MSLYSLKVSVSVFVVFVFVVSHRNNLQFARGDTANPQLVVFYTFGFVLAICKCI